MSYQTGDKLGDRAADSLARLVATVATVATSA